MSATNSKKVFAIPCPTCGRKLKVPADRIDVRCRCSVCQEPLTPQLPVDDEPYSPADDSRSIVSSRGWDDLTNDLSLTGTLQSGDRYDIIYDADDVIETPAISSAFASRPAGLSMRAKHWLVWGGIRFGLGFFLFLSGGIIPPIGCLGLLLLAWYWPARCLARQVTAGLSPTIDCPGCGFQIDAVGRWTIGSYTDHREQHILLAKSPLDGGTVGHTDCPQCGATILV